jgi:chromosome segregation ATPase
MMSRETERDLAAMVRVEKRAKETARAERDDLRRQLAEVQTALESLTPGGSEFVGDPNACLEWIAKRISTAGKIAAERNDVRRQLEATQAELDQVRQERDRARRALRVRDLEDTGLYDAYGQPLK